MKCLFILFIPPLTRRHGLSPVRPAEITLRRAFKCVLGRRMPACFNRLFSDQRPFVLALGRNLPRHWYIWINAANVFGKSSRNLYEPECRIKCNNSLPVGPFAWSNVRLYPQESKIGLHQLYKALVVRSDLTPKACAVLKHTLCKYAFFSCIYSILCVFFGW